MANFGTKKVLFGNFWFRIFKKLLSYLKSALSTLSICKILQKFGTKNALFGCFGARLLKRHCHIWNQHLWICLLALFRKKAKCLNLGPKMLYFRFGYFWARILKQILSYLKSAPSNWFNFKITSWKNENR